MCLGRKSVYVSFQGLVGNVLDAPGVLVHLQVQVILPRHLERVNGGYEQAALLGVRCLWTQELLVAATLHEKKGLTHDRVVPQPGQLEAEVVGELAEYLGDFILEDVPLEI